MTTISSREFNQHASDAKKAANRGPVFITDRGRPAHVLLSIADYHQLAGCQMSLLDALAQQDVEDIDFEPPQVTAVFRAADLS